MTVNYYGVTYYIDQQTNTASVGNKQATCPNNLNILPAVDYNGRSYRVRTISANVFYKCGINSFYGIPEGITTIEDHAFYVNNITADVLTLPESLESIGGLAFPHNSFKEIHIGSKLNSYGNVAFGRIGVKKFIVNPSNPNFCNDEQFCLYNKQKTELLQAAGFYDELIIPSSVTTLRPQAIDGISIRKLTLPRNIQIDKIKDGFYIGFCPYLKKIYIICNLYPFTISTEGFIIEDCNSLKSIHYYGSSTPGNNLFGNLESKPKIYVIEQGITSIMGQKTIFIPSHNWFHSCPVYNDRYSWKYTVFVHILDLSD